MSLEQNDKKIKLLLGAMVTITFTGLIYQVWTVDARYNLTYNEIKVEQSQVVGELGKNSGVTGQDSQSSPNNFYIAASKSGTRYYYQKCSGLSRIKPENLVYFDSESQAEAKGYSLAQNCKKP